MLGTVVCDALMRHCLSDGLNALMLYVIQCQHTFIEGLAACATRRRAGGLLRVRRRRRLPPLFGPELLRFRQQLPYRRPLGCKLPVMGTRAAGGYVGMSEGWLGTVCALFLRSFNAATTLWLH